MNLNSTIRTIIAAHFAPFYANTPNNVMTPQAAVLGHADLSAATAITSRAKITGTTGLTALVPTVSTDCKVTKIQVKGSSTSMTATSGANLVGIWENDGTTSWLVREIEVAAVVPSTTAKATEAEINLVDFTLPATHSLYASVSVTTTASTTALTVHAFGATL